MNMTVLLFSLALFPMVMALLCYCVGRTSDRARNVLLTATGAAEFALALAASFTAQGTAQMTDVCALGVHLQLDGFRKLQVLIIGMMWLMTILFSPEYFAQDSKRNRYYFFNLMTLGATMGVFLAADLFTAFVFFEVMSFASYVWVVQSETPGALRAGSTYLAIGVIGGLAALMGLFLLQHHLGTLCIDELYAAAQQCANKAVLYCAGACILVGFGAKAGMFPLHIWLPKAHPVAPAPASALLSGILTKTGIWGILAISCNVFRYDPAWGTMILVLGTITMVLGAVLALFSNDIKRTLACSSLSQIGFILVGVGMMGLLGEHNALAARGAVLHMMNHSLFKLVLFMVAGVVYINLHVLDLNDVRGFGRKKPLLNACFLMGAVGIGGIPLFNGYVSKTLLHESIVEYSHLLAEQGFATGAITCVEWLFLLSGGFTLAYMTKLYVAIFLEKHPTRQAEFDAMRHYIRPVSAAAIAIPAVLIPVLGLTASFSMDRIADMATDFFKCGALEHAVHYLTWTNLKGALISVVIAMLLYFVVVRKLLMKHVQGHSVYCDRWPKWLDLENLVYRPLLLRVLPGIFGVAARIVCDLPDAFVLLLRRTIYREAKVISYDRVSRSLTYHIGQHADNAAQRHGKKLPKHYYAQKFYADRVSYSDASRKITSNLSFALMMFCTALCIGMLYILLF